MNLAAIVRHDLRQMRRTRALRSLLLCFAALLVYAAWTGAQASNERRGVIERLEAERGKSAEEDLARVASGDLPSGLAPWDDPANPARRTTVAVLPPAPLSALAGGLADLAPYWAEVTIHSLASAPFRFHEIGSPLHRLLGRFDLTFVAVYLLPLLLIVLCFDLVSGERERGTLRLILAQPVSLRRLLGIRLLARVTLAAGLVLGGGALALGLQDVGLDAHGWLAFATWCGCVVAYAAFWSALALALQAAPRASSANALWLVTSWLVLVVIVPAAAAIAVEGLQPTPSRYAYLAVERSAENASQQRASELLERFALDHPELLPPDGAVVADFTRRYYAARRDLDERLAPVVRQHEAALAAQQRWVALLRLASPAIAAHQAMLEVTGTGAARQVRYRAEVRAFLDAWRAFLVPKTFRGERMEASDFAELPRFSWVEEPAPVAAQRALAACLGVLLLTLAVLVWAWQALGRRLEP